MIPRPGGSTGWPPPRPSLAVATGHRPLPTEIVEGLTRRIERCRVKSRVRGGSAEAVETFLRFLEEPERPEEARETIAATLVSNYGVTRKTLLPALRKTELAHVIRADFALGNIAYGAFFGLVWADRYLRKYREDRGDVFGLAEIGALLEELGIPSSRLAEHALSLKSGTKGFGWLEDDAVWPFYLDHLDVLQRGLEEEPPMYKHDIPSGAYRVLASFPVAPPQLHEAYQRLRRERSTTVDSSGTHLLSAVFTQPDDDAPRLVYGDWLLERGDPRGEFIRLQFQKLHQKLTPVQVRRERQLTEAHGRTWLGPLVLVAKSFRFERGFLAACSATLTSKRQRATIGDPHWATVRELTLSQSRDAVQGSADLLSSDCLSSLEVLNNVAAESVFRGLSQSGKAKLRELRRMSVSLAESGVPGSDPNHPSYWRSLCELAPPSLRCLSIKAKAEATAPGREMLSALGLQNTKLARQLEVLHLPVDGGPEAIHFATEIFQKLPALLRVELSLHPRILIRLDRPSPNYHLRMQLIRPWVNRPWETPSKTLDDVVVGSLLGIFSAFPRKDMPGVDIGIDGRTTKKDVAQLKVELGPLVDRKFEVVNLPFGNHL